MADQVLPPDARRAKEYSVANWVPFKILLSDGSVVEGLPITITAEGVINISSKTPLTPLAPLLQEIGVTSQLVVAANADRKGLELVNSSQNYISIAFGTDAVLYAGKTMAPNGSFAMDEYDFTLGAVYAIASGASSSLGVQEFE